MVRSLKHLKNKPFLVDGMHFIIVDTFLYDHEQAQY